jgi:hypothetical protein
LFFQIQQTSPNLNYKESHSFKDDPERLPAVMNADNPATWEDRKLRIQPRLQSKTLSQTEQNKITKKMFLKDKLREHSVVFMLCLCVHTTFVQMMIAVIKVTTF